MAIWVKRKRFVGRVEHPCISPGDDRDEQRVCFRAMDVRYNHLHEQKLFSACSEGVEREWIRTERRCALKRLVQCRGPDPKAIAVESTH